MTAEEVLIKLKPLLSSKKLGDLLKAKEALFAAMPHLSGPDRDRVSEEISSLQQSIEIAMKIDYSKLPPDEEGDEIPTLNMDGTWKNSDKLE